MMMMMSSTADGQLSNLTSSSSGVASRVVNYLKAKYPVKTADNVAADTNLKADMVRKWLGRGSTPSGEVMLALIRAYGPEFLISVMTGADMPAWLTSVGQAEAIAGRSARLDKLKANRASLRA